MGMGFLSQIWICYIFLSQKWFETKSKHTAWTLGLKCDHRVWPWPWHWPWIFKVKCGIYCISAKNGPTGTKQKALHGAAMNIMNIFSHWIKLCSWRWPDAIASRWISTTRSFGVFFDLCLIKRPSKHSRGWWFETLSRTRSTDRP